MRLLKILKNYISLLGKGMHLSSVQFKHRPSVNGDLSASLKQVAFSHLDLDGVFQALL